MYKVIKHFTDLHDADHPYNVGDIFPREGIKVAEKRLAELAGSDNRQGTPLIALVKDESVPEEPVEQETAEEEEEKKPTPKKGKEKKTSGK